MMNFVKLIVCLLFLSVCVGKQLEFTNDDAYYDNIDDDEIEKEEVVTDVKGQLPTFNQKSQEIVITEHENLTLDCTTTTDEDFMIVRKKGKINSMIFVGEMKVTASYKFEINNSLVTLADVQRTDSGIYECVYQNTLDEEVVIAFKVDVQFPPTVSSTVSRTQTVSKGSTVTVDCKVTGNPKPEITWSKSKGRLPSGEQTEKGYSLVLGNINRHAEGTYICQADNGIGKPESIEMKILVQYAPEILTEKAIIRHEDGDSMKLVCIVHARPAASLEWSRDGEPIPNNSVYKETNVGHRHTLTISKISENDFGAYKCSADNSWGNDSEVIHFSDELKQPSFTSNDTSAVETMYTLAWEAESYYPIISYTVKYRATKANETTDLPGDWHEESVTLSEEDNFQKIGLVHRMTHELKNLLPGTEYQAAVTVKNRIKQANEASFNFSTTKKAVTTTSPPITDDEQAMYSHKEEKAGFQSKPVGSGEYLQLSLSLLFVTLALSLKS